jgi:hypothetical protein
MRVVVWRQWLGSMGICYALLTQQLLGSFLMAAFCSRFVSMHRTSDSATHRVRCADLEAGQGEGCWRAYVAAGLSTPHPLWCILCMHLAAPFMHALVHQRRVRYALHARAVFLVLHRTLLEANAARCLRGGELNGSCL